MVKFKKKAYLKTIEVVLAMVLTFSVILYIMPITENTPDQDTKDILLSISQNEEFRQSALSLDTCAYKQANVSITNILDERLRPYLNYSICAQGNIPVLPRKTVNVESLYLMGNITLKNNKIIRLYYWG